MGGSVVPVAYRTGRIEGDCSEFHLTEGKALKSRLNCQKRYSTRIWPKALMTALQSSHSFKNCPTKCSSPSSQDQSTMHNGQFVDTGADWNLVNNALLRANWQAHTIGVKISR